MRSPAYVILIVASLGLSLMYWGRLGLATKSSPVPIYPRQTLFFKNLALPHGLPTPIAQFYDHLYDQAVRLIEPAVLAGQDALRAYGIDFPPQFRLALRVQQAYRRYFRAVFFRPPFLAVGGHYLNGRAGLYASPPPG